MPTVTYKQMISHFADRFKQNVIKKKKEEAAAAAVDENSNAIVPFTTGVSVGIIILFGVGGALLLLLLNKR